MPTELTLKDGRTRTDSFAKGDKSGEELLQVSDFPSLYEISPGTVKELRQYNRTRQVLANQAADQDGDQGLDNVAAPHREVSGQGG
jgi:hypothetical protein